MPRNAAILFAGQGSQKPGMGRALFAEFDSLLSKAEPIAKFDIREYCLQTASPRFNDTRYVQPALYTVNALYYQKYLESNPGIAVEFFAGHSLGEFNALLAAHVFDFETGLALVTKRAELMAAAPAGRMAAVLGLSAQEVAEVIAENQLADISIANYNSDLQVVVSGSVDGITAAEEVFYDNFAVKYVVLNVSGAFHSTLMDAAAKEYAQYLKTFSFAKPTATVIANLTAKPYSADSVVENLSNHINNPVQWSQSIRCMKALGVSTFAEMGEQTMLTDLLRNIR